jgi:hypothetical protein
MTEVVMKWPSGTTMAELQMCFDLLNCKSDTKLAVAEDGMLGYYGPDGKLMRTATLKEVYGDRAVQTASGQWRLML